MGIEVCKYTKCILASALLCSTATFAGPTVMDRLESGEVISSKAGSAIVVQQIIKKSSSKVTEALFSDIRKLPRLFSNIAFVRAYTTSDGKNLVYLKLRGLGDGQAVLMQVKDGGGDTFNTAPTLEINSSALGLRDIRSEVDLQADSQVQELVESTKDAKSSVRRRMGVGSQLVLEGPLNQVFEMPALRLTINIGLGGYKVTKPDPKDPKNEYLGETILDASYLVAKVAVGSRTPQGELGDYKGFGDHRLDMAQLIGGDVFRGLKSRLENL